MDLNFFEAWLKLIWKKVNMKKSGFKYYGLSLLGGKWFHWFLHDFLLNHNTLYEANAFFITLLLILRILSSLPPLSKGEKNHLHGGGTFFLSFYCKII